MTDILNDLRPALIDLLVAILLAAIPLVTMRITTLTGVKIEAVDRAALHSAIQSGVNAAIAGGAKVGGDALLREAITYARRSVPDAIKRLGPSDDVLKTLAERYVAQILSPETRM